MQNKNQSGRTMLEMLGVLSIMGIITYGVISGINYGMTSYNINQLYIEISNIINETEQMYLMVYGKGTFTDLCCESPDTDCAPGSCEKLRDNGILRAKLTGLKIEISGGILTVKYTAPERKFCERLKEMDWAGQSIKIQEENPCNASPYELTFQSK